jgi:hypothetical protein
LILPLAKFYLAVIGVELLWLGVDYAFYGMVCCSFLKSLRIPEEFRKNSYIKITPKPPCKNSHGLAKFQNPLEISNQFLIESSP